jgi:hypothetical protein
LTRPPGNDDEFDATSSPDSTPADRDELARGRILEVAPFVTIADIPGTDFVKKG